MTIVYTIGYEGTDIDSFVLTLQEAGVDLLADVRALALSRKKGFSKNALRSRLTATGIGYAHLVDLGDPKTGREAARAGHFAEFRRIYSRHLSTAEAQADLNTLAAAVRTRTVCLMCFERQPEHCHRSMVGQALRAADVAIENLFSPSTSVIYGIDGALARTRSRQSASATK
jgi:uncharacterized protein (DUF488 family)